MDLEDEVERQVLYQNVRTMVDERREVAEVEQSLFEATQYNDRAGNPAILG
jgi:hypothetical protein